MAGLEKHKSNVNRWKCKCLVSLNFFLKNISSFLFLRQSKGKMHSRKEAGRRREQAGASEKLVQKTCSPLGASASPGGCQNWLGAATWSHPPVPRTGVDWGQRSQSSSICPATNFKKNKWIWTNCQIRTSSGKKWFEFCILLWPLLQQLCPFPPSPPCWPTATPRQRPHL